ncbi:MAG: SWIM zinc finger family protein, partial [Treponema sp.]|nr:SWIM zinc finger family protein [Treponema sp.]
MKNQYGVTPWGSWFLDVLDSYEMGARLDRGRTYANTGKVLSLELEPGRAIAKVKGKYRPSYRVEIKFPPLEEAEQVYKMIEEDPPLLAQIAAGELPEKFLDELMERDIELIPWDWEEMERSCTCPDEYGDPCKHMAALYYIIAKEIDADPHVLFRLRGMNLAERFGAAAVRSLTAPFAIILSSEEKVNKNTPNTTALVVVEQEPLDLEEIPNCINLITALLPPQPPFCKRDFALVLAEFYHRSAHYKSWESAGAEQYYKMEHGFSRSIWKVICANPGPGAEVFLDAKDINGDIRRFTLLDAFEYFVSFSSDDGTSSYGFLFYLFKFLNLVCQAGAFIPYIFVNKKNLKIIWRPFETLPVINDMLIKIAARECGMLDTPGAKKASGRSVVDLVSSAFLNEWVYRRSLAFRSSLGKQGGGAEFQELLDLFFFGREINVSSPASRSLPHNIDRWLSVFHINFSAYKYNLTLK